MIYPLVKQNASTYTDPQAAIWLDTSKSGFWTNWAKNSDDYYGYPYTAMIFKAGEREKNWNRVPSNHGYIFVCTAVFK